MLADHHLGVRGYVMQSGGIDAHASIIARDFGTPAVVRVSQAMARIHEGDMLIIDGSAGLVVCNPDVATLEQYEQRRVAEDQQRMRQAEAETGPALTVDGTRIRVEANIDVPEQVPMAVRLGAEGLGLVRTEMMIASRNEIPTVEEQIRWYEEICQGVDAMPVTFRVFDFGGDKIDVGQTYTEDNPALGLRGIRFLLSQPEILRNQITALLEIARRRPIRCMLPMITTAVELDRAVEIIDECRTACAARHGSCPEMPLGIMIETPAAALSADILARQVDFLSIGTNDLTQYTLAVDRTNDLVSNVSDGLHPSVLKLIAMTVSAARSAGIDVTVCGEMAGQTAALDVLVGLGVTGLSVSPFLLNDVRSRIRGLDAHATAAMLPAVLLCRSAEEVRRNVEEFRSNGSQGNLRERPQAPFHGIDDGGNDVHHCSSCHHSPGCISSHSVDSD